jgi:hypothetical protein
MKSCVVIMCVFCCHHVCFVLSLCVFSVVIMCVLCCHVCFVLSLCVFCVVIMCVLCCHYVCFVLSSCVFCVEVYWMDMTFQELAAMQTLGDCYHCYYFQYLGISDEVGKKN